MPVSCQRFMTLSRGLMYIYQHFRGLVYILASNESGNSVGLPCIGTCKMFAVCSHWTCIAIWLALCTENLHDDQRRSFSD